MSTAQYRVAALSAVAKRADPHTIKLIEATVMIHNSLRHKAGKPVSEPHDLNRR